jgi:hypothetical protein
MDIFERIRQENSYNAERIQEALAMNLPSRRQPNTFDQPNVSSRQPTMLSIEEFAEVAEFKLNDVLPVNLLWDSHQKELPIYICEQISRIFVQEAVTIYSSEHDTIHNSEHMRAQDVICELADEYVVPYIRLTNSQYIDFLDHFDIQYANGQLGELADDYPTIRNYYPDILVSALVDATENSSAETTHLLFTPVHLKMLTYVTDDPLGRSYSRALDDLFRLYHRYRLAYITRLTEISTAAYAEVDDIIAMLDDLAVEQANLLDTIKETNSRAERIGLMGALAEINHDRADLLDELAEISVMHEHADTLREQAAALREQADALVNP